MEGKRFWRVLFCYVSVIVGIFQPVHTAPLYSPSSSASLVEGQQRLSNGRVLVAELDKPLDAVLEAVMELGGNVLFLVPQRDFEKRDPPDLGTGRSYSGQRTAKVMWGQLASNSPSGPGRRKRNASNHDLLQDLPPGLGSLLVPEVP